jgi:6-phosphogluconolactonase (cycloisomerase 2 family)
MKKYPHWGFILILVLALTLTGCGGGSKPPEPRHFAYVIDESGMISAFLVNSSGVLSPVSSITTEPGNSSRSLAADPSGKFLYVAKYGSSTTVAAYSINATTGALDPVAGSPFTTDNNPKKLAVDPTGNFVAVGCIYRLNIFSRDQTNGALSSRASFSFAPDQELGAICFDKTGQYLYVAVSTGHIYVYAKNAESNTFSQVGSPYPTRNTPTSMAFNPSGSHLFVSTIGITTIPIHPVNGDGSLGTYTSLNIGTQSYSLVIDGNNLYIAHLSGISSYSIENPSLIPQIGTTLSLGAGSNPASLVFDPSKNFLYVTGWNSKKIWVFARNSEDGGLTAVTESTLETDADISEIITVTTTN